MLPVRGPACALLVIHDPCEGPLWDQRSSRTPYRGEGAVGAARVEVRAEQSAAADCFQPPLVPRCGFQARLTPGVEAVGAKAVGARISTKFTYRAMLISILTRHLSP